MKRRIMTKHTGLIVAAFLLTSVHSAEAQMSKRWISDYNNFATTAPAVRSYAPDLCLWDLDGRPRSLKLEEGRTIVLINGSCT